MLVFLHCSIGVGGIVHLTSRAIALWGNLILMMVSTEKE